MSSSHFGVHSSYLRVLGATDAHVLLGLTRLQFYLWYLETHFICEHKRDQNSPASEAQIQWFTHTSSTLPLGGLGSQPAPSTAVPRHAAAFAPDICHSELVLSHLCELGQPLQSLSQECCLRKGIHVNRIFMQE